MSRNKEYENRQPYSFNLDTELITALKKRYSNASEIVNELIEQHLVGLELIEPKKRNYMAPYKATESDVFDEEWRELTRKLDEQAKKHRELCNAIYWMFRRAGRTAEVLRKRINFFEEIHNKPLKVDELIREFRNRKEGVQQWL